MKIIIQLLKIILSMNQINFENENEEWDDREIEKSNVIAMDFYSN